MKIAVYQGPGKPARMDLNLATLRDQATAAAGQDAGLVIFPEMFLTGYNIGDTIFELAETANGPSIQKAAAIARQAGIAVLFGYPERNGDQVFNAAILIDRNGNPLANYRKSHLYGPEEKRLFAPGAELVLTEVEGIRIGILICYDVEFPEAVRALTLAGADFIAVPTALMHPYCMIARKVVPVRAYENQIYVAYINRCGEEGDMKYCGLSCLCGPDGEDIVRAGTGTELLFADIDRDVIKTTRNENPVLADMRLDLYQSQVNTIP